MRMTSFLSSERIRGAVAVEYGILLPAFLALVLGIMDTGRLLWTQTALDRAVEAAARCAAVDTIRCATAAQVQAYGADQAFGMTITSSAFSVSAAGCGMQVSAEYPFQLIIPWLARSELTLTATACYPN